MKKFFFICIILLTSIFYGCDFFGPGSADYGYNLSDKYRIERSSTINTELIKREDSNSSRITVVVQDKVTGIAWDENFILVEQTNNDSKKYWIIDIKQDKEYGQLNQEDFDKQRQELKIDSKLKLESPDKYKSLDPSNENMK